MAKYLKLFMVALFATMTFTLTSCGDDEDEPSSGNQIEINGKKWTVKNDYFVPMGFWMESADVMKAAFWNIFIPDDNSQTYMFCCENCDFPKKGDDFSKIGKLRLSLTNSSSDTYDYVYESGSAKIIDTNQSKERMTIQYDNLKMIKGNQSYVFNGTVTIPWNYDE